MRPHQKFRLGSRVESIAVRQAADGTYYSELTDIWDTFPSASKLKIDGVTLVWLKDEQGHRYEPLRIEHHPDDIVDITVDTSVHVPISISTALMGQYAPTTAANQAHLIPCPEGVEQSTTTLALRPPLLYAPPPVTSTTLSISDNHLYQNPLATLGTIVTTTRQIVKEVEASSAQNSANHQEQMVSLIRTWENINLVLQGQEDARMRDEEILMVQKQTINRLVATQQRVDALLVQNFELHEYPIPRRFVVLPDSYNTLDPRRAASQRYRLYFLCECGEHCGTDEDRERDASSSVPVKNQVHLANHEGYELTRPTEFFERYGPYVLGLLRILKHCLAAASFAAPAVSLAQSQIGSIMQGVESITKNTIEAVNTSITFLEKRLEDNDTADNVASFQSSQSGIDLADMISDLRALEGADLRRLDTFLRNKDKDKILGNLYRIVTIKGHVKWVCLQHYQASYRASAMKAFIQIVEASEGIYDPHLGKVTITLKSDVVSRDFFTLLAGQAAAVVDLDVTLDYRFGSSDLSTLVDMLVRSNVTTLRLDLKDEDIITRMPNVVETGNATTGGLTSKYGPLTRLLANKTIRRVDLIGSDFFGNRTSNLFKAKQGLSTLRSFRYSSQIRDTDWGRLLEIVLFSPELRDLRLGKLPDDTKHSYSFIFAYFALAGLVFFVAPAITASTCAALYSITSSRFKLRHSTFSLSDLRSLHAYGPTYGVIHKLVKVLQPTDSTPSALTELVFIDAKHISNKAQQLIRRISSRLEVLILDTPLYTRLFDRARLEVLLLNKPLYASLLHNARHNMTPTIEHVDLHLASPQASDYPFFKLTHLHLAVDLTEPTLCQFASVLPTLQLIHFGADQRSQSLLKHVNFKTLQSINLFRMDEGYLQPMFDTLLSDSHSCQLEKLFLGGITGIERLPGFLEALPLKELHMIGLPLEALDKALQGLNLSKLAHLSIFHAHYDWSTETLLASRSNEFTEKFCMHLEKVSEVSQEFGIMNDFLERAKGGVYSDRSRLEQGSPTALPRSRVRLLKGGLLTKQYWESILSTISP
ncbi:hypothetical protein BGZ88_007960 [Linnemannia elongata]|nr:hypothetical protein BGZ88_007960 [Linnemannia elongata]